ncbi:MAG: phosphopantetheine-binding protein [Caulobacter sp.]
MSALYAGLAEIFEVDESEISPAAELAAFNWDSLAIISTLALVDEVHGVLLDGKALGACGTVADIEALIAKEAA